MIFEDVVYKTYNGGSSFYYTQIWGHNGIGKLNLINTFRKDSEASKFFDLDFFYSESEYFERILLYGLGFRESGYIGDLKLEMPKYNKPVLGGIIDEHILLRLKGMMDSKRLGGIDITYYSENEKFIFF